MRDQGDRSCLFAWWREDAGKRQALQKLDPLVAPAEQIKQLAALDATRYSAIELFCERARAADLRFALTSDNAQAVADICRRLGVFVSGFPLELAQPVARDEQLDEWAVLEALSALVDKSLVIADSAEPPRDRLLETTRAYAMEKLAAAGETDAWIVRHAQVLCAFFERAEGAYRGPRATLSNMGFIRPTAPELDNARVALAWAGSGTDKRGDLNLAVGLAAPVSQLLLNLGLAAEAIERLTSLEDRIDASVDPARAALLWCCLATAGLSGRRPMAQSLDAAARAEAIFRTAALPRRLAYMSTLRAQLLAIAGDWRSAQNLVGEVCSLQDAARPHSPPSPPWPPWPISLIGERLAAQGWIHMVQGQLEQALAVHREQRALLLAAPGERRGLIFSEGNVCRDLLLLERHDECIALARSVIQREGGPRQAQRGRFTCCSCWGSLPAAASPRRGRPCSHP